MGEQSLPSSPQPLLPLSYIGSGNLHRLRIIWELLVRCIFACKISLTNVLVMDHIQASRAVNDEVVLATSCAGHEVACLGDETVAIR